MKFLPAFFLAIVCSAGLAFAQAPTGSITPSSTVYSPNGGMITFTINLTYTGELTAIGITVPAPAGWIYRATGGTNPPGITPENGVTGPFEFAYANIPASPISFTFTLEYLAGLTGPQSFPQVQALIRPGFVEPPFKFGGVTLTPSTPVVTAPIITIQPVDTNGTTAASVNLSVTATGTAPLSYQWRKDGANVPGGTNATLIVPGLVANSGSYVVVVTNSLGSVTSNVAQVRIVDAALAVAITAQPGSRSVTPGANVVFSVVATGPGPIAYQWRKNGTAIAGARTANLELSNVTVADAGSYDVVVSNAASSVTSAVAQLIVTPASSAPAISTQPVAQSVPVGAAATFAVVASGTPAPTYQWRKDGAVVPGATSATLTFATVTEAHAGAYSVVVSNSAGSVSSASATLTVTRASFAGVYFGTLGNGGLCALHVGDNNSGAFLAFDAATRTGYIARSLTVDSTGRFRLTATPGGGVSAATGAGSSGSAPPVAAAANDLVIDGTIAANGTVTGTAASGGGLGLAATRAATSGTTAAAAAFYQAGAAGSSAQLLAIVSADGRAFALVNSAGGYDGGMGTLETITTSGQQTIALQIASGTAIMTATVTDANRRNSTYTGFAAGASALAEQRIVNISTRTTAGTGDQVAIVGFVIDGTASKTVLIRAIGPTLRSFGVTTALAEPALEVRRDAALMAANTGWSTVNDGGAVAAAANRAGAFPLGATSADSALLVTLEPGRYTATVSAADGRPGAGLIEVYDLSPASTAQKLVNLSTRAVTGAGDSTLIAGVVVSGTAPKRLLIRGAGPALAQFGLGNVLSRPQLTLFAGDSVVAQNAGWSTSTDAAAIAETGAQVGAFAFSPGSADAALLLNLAPGAYTAQLTGISGTAGLALVEIYEVP